MGLFIEIELDAGAAKDEATARKLAEVCPVGIFEVDAAGHAQVVERNVDECTLCELCLAVPGEPVKVKKLYDGGARLERTG